jgi:hypothetical protein
MCTIQHLCLNLIDLIAEYAKQDFPKQQLSEESKLPAMNRDKNNTSRFASTVNSSQKVLSTIEGLKRRERIEWSILTALRWLRRPRTPSIASVSSPSSETNIPTGQSENGYLSSVVSSKTACWQAVTQRDW